MADRSHPEAAPNATEGPTQTSIPQVGASTRSVPAETELTCCQVAFTIPFMVIGLVIGLAIVNVCAIVTPVLMLVFLTGSSVALSLVQFIRHGPKYDKATQLKSVIRFWILVDVVCLSFAAGLTYPVVKFAFFKHVVLMELTIANWLSISLTLFILYILDFVVNTLLHFLPPIPLEHNESGLNVQEASVEIVDCLVFMLAESTALNRIPSFKQQKIVGLYTWKWIEVLICVSIGCNVVRVCSHLSAWLLRKVVGENLDPARMTHPQYKLLVQKLLPRQYFVYYANGFKWSINFALSSLLVLLTWVLYFRSHLSKTPLAERILHFGTRTWLSIFICSILWLFKTWLVLYQEAIAMYTRFRSEIIKSGNQLYFLGILGRHSHDIFKLTYYGPIEKTATDSGERLEEGYVPIPDSNISTQESNQTNRGVEEVVAESDYWFEVTELHKCCMDERNLNSGGETHTLCQTIVAYISCILELTSPDFYNLSIRDKEDDDLGERTVHQLRVKKLSAKKRKTTNYDLLMHHRTPTMHDLSQISQYLISAKKALSDQTFVSSILSRLNADSDSNIREKLKQLMDDKSKLNGAPSDPRGLPNESKEDEFVTQYSSGSPINENENETAMNDWEYFEQQVLRNQDCSEKLIRTWLGKAQNSCLFLANALSSAKEVVDCLNKIVSCFIISATFILWILLTGLARTEVLVLIASPLLAATFIFGDTCKTLFQGFMFVYVVHPIHVGDLCSIDDNKTVVKAVGIWTTTFCKVEKLGTQEEVTYPNSELANKVVISHLTEFDWDDSVEFNIGSLLDSDVQELKQQIESHLNTGQDEFVSCSHRVVKQVAEDDSKIIIQLKYKISDIQDWSYLKCVRRKKRLQADVDDLVQKFKRRSKQRLSEGVLTS